VRSAPELVRQIYVALGARDYAMLSSLAEPDFELDLTERVLNPATYRGEEGMQRFLDEIDELWTSMDIHVERMLERGDEVLAVLMVKLTGRGSGVQLDSRIAQHWVVSEGRARRMRLRVDPDAAVEEFEAGG
jgi:ketosteroid isomerase-like protein